ncbi:hypothetical protein M4I33_10580 [Clostridium sp. LY3-2]|uniref:hypothetical protein n=1 Tax=Clostridium sp. LY3-2 TaxID=2942482 RepID=UPI00215371FC|nr:hypothetical protein [Clostridium sp. LY3-2]MCR6515313.1 hypothetical protein [Clostridium sp. LY3-2]
MKMRFVQIKKLISKLEEKGLNRTKDEDDLLKELKLVDLVTKDGVYLNESLKMDPNKCPTCGRPR